MTTSTGRAKLPSSLRLGRSLALPILRITDDTTIVVECCFLPVYWAGRVPLGWWSSIVQIKPFLDMQGTYGG